MAARSTKYSKAFQKRLDDEASMDPSGFSLAQPFRAVESRCKRRWYDYQRLHMDLANMGVANGPKPIVSAGEAQTLLRERWLLFVQCTESKAGEEPRNPYLYLKYT